MVIIIVLLKQQAKGSLNENESPKWRSKVSTKSKTKRSIFNSCSTQKEATSEAKNQTSLSTRKRVSLSLGLNTPKLKQTTLNFSNVSLAQLSFKTDAVTI